jgi:hypothetical protein
MATRPCVVEGAASFLLRQKRIGGGAEKRAHADCVSVRYSVHQRGDAKYVLAVWRSAGGEQHLERAVMRVGSSECKRREAVDVLSSRVSTPLQQELDDARPPTKGGLRADGAWSTRAGLLTVGGATLINAVLPVSPSTMSTVAPRLSSASAAPRWPRYAAQWSAVFPSSLAASTSVLPRDRSSTTLCSSSCHVASMSAVFPCESGSFASSPPLSARSNRATSTESPDFAAARSAAART